MTTDDDEIGIDRFGDPHDLTGRFADRRVDDDARGRYERADRTANALDVRGIDTPLRR